MTTIRSDWLTPAPTLNPGAVIEVGGKRYVVTDAPGVGQFVLAPLPAPTTLERVVLAMRAEREAHYGRGQDAVNDEQLATAALSAAVFVVNSVEHTHGFAVEDCQWCDARSAILRRLTDTS